MSLKSQFRLHYGEGKIKEKDFRLFRLGYEYAIREVSDLWQRGNFTTDVLAKMLRSQQEKGKIKGVGEA